MFHQVNSGPRTIAASDFLRSARPSLQNNWLRNEAYNAQKFHVEMNEVKVKGWNNLTRSRSRIYNKHSHFLQRR